MRLIRLALPALLAWPFVAAGQGFPSKPVRLVVANAPGGSQDSLARALSPRLSEALGQPVIVDNRPGAAGLIAGSYLAKSAPDGHTLYVAPFGHYTARYFFRDVPFDPKKDFTPITNLTLIPNVLVAHTALPVHSVEELIRYGKRNPDKMHYGTYAIGSINHLAGILLSQITGVDLQHVPYKGGAPAVADLVAGQLPFAILGASTVLPHARTGKLRMLAVIENRRFASVPGVPAVGESVPNYAVPDSWIGLIGPAGIPRAIVEQLNAETRKAMQTPGVKQRLESLGFEVIANTTAEQFAAAIDADMAVMGRLVALAGIKPE